MNKISFNKFYILCYFLMGIGGILLLVFVSIFLYKNFYQTITSSQEILVLKKQVFYDDIDMNKLDYIVKRLEKKIEPRSTEINLNF